MKHYLPIIVLFFSGKTIFVIYFYSGKSKGHGTQVTAKNYCGSCKTFFYLKCAKNLQQSHFTDLYEIKKET